MIKLNSNTYRDKIYACWLGKNIGGTMGGPFEGKRELLNVTGFTTPKDTVLPNDDLDLQLVWLAALERTGAKNLNAKVLGEYWLNYIPPHWHEYGIGKVNMQSGLMPPLCGDFRNEWKHSNGAWIRTEVWACLAPACPDIAVKYAYEDAVIDHGCGEGTIAAIFIAAIESAAFIEPNKSLNLDVVLSNHLDYGLVPYYAELSWILPEGFSVSGAKSVMVPHLTFRETDPKTTLNYTITAGEKVESINELALKIKLKGNGTYFIPINIMG